MSPFHGSLIGLVLAGSLVGFAFQGPVRIWLGVLLAVLYGGILAFGVFRIQAGFFLQSFCRGDGDEKAVALTFDDGPDPSATPAVLDVLAESGSKAAFFCVGQKIEAHPDLAARLDREGHIIGNHSYRHAWWTNFLWGERLEREIRAGRDAIVSTIDKSPRFYRPPVGLTNPHLPGVLKKLGLDCIGYDVRSLDRTEDIQGVLERILTRVRPGSIILLHDGGLEAGHRARLVKDLVRALHQSGYTIKRLDKLLTRPAYR